MNLNRLVVLSSALLVAIALAPRSARAATPSFELPALSSTVLTQSPDAAAPEAPRRWHWGLELGAGVNPWGPSDSLQAIGSASALFGWDVTEHFEVEALASLVVSVEGGAPAGAVRALYLVGDHLAVGATVGFSNFVYAGPRVELRAGPFFLAYEPIVISSSHPLDYHDTSDPAVIPLRALVGVQF